MAFLRGLKLAACAQLLRAGFAEEAPCEAAEGCAAEETGLLQVSSSNVALGAAVPGHYVINMRGRESAGGDCKNGIKLAISNVHIPSGTSMQYSFPHLTGNSHCDPVAGDAPGPTSCCGELNSDATMSYDLETDQFPTSAWKAHIKAQLSGNIFGWHHVGDVEFSCAICGKPCHIPDIHVSVVTVAGRDIPMPDCPAPEDGDNFIGTLALMLPKDLSLPTSAKAEAAIQLLRPDNSAVASLDLTAVLSP
mmetsp:Transcript_63618/g.178060  ORF Transcript_63618/g.178060 Transcript_63618/m.178060 type:complete len:249 (-) Transcript_63618:119-865(-)